MMHYFYLEESNRFLTLPSHNYDGEAITKERNAAILKEKPLTRKLKPQIKVKAHNVLGGAVAPVR